ncbi:transmembrane protein 41A [Seminavis robusta]|uniref:Transmembrane protein 41A n=1 Tax=Seminavis robusta TaxID=568900 RepID=A0A9N8DSV1_9STRA|nr:transmembrane protein 41A [Seminavis robusta]|eukprot:Sro253_g099980.1 transmembrane protein 41A (302) ;mRNA; r:62010-63075
MHQGAFPADRRGGEEAAVGGTNGRRQRVILGLLLVVALAAIALDYFTKRRIEKACLGFIHWVEVHPLLGVLAVICVYALATILFIPGAILTVGCGYAFRSAFDSTAKGVMFATVAVFLGAFIGSLCSFLLGRYLFRDCVMQLASNYPILRAIDRALEQNGLKIMLLLRLSPLIPFNALDYISGVTSISFRDYAIALIAILPGTIMFCMVGATASSLTDTSTSSENKLASRISLVGGLLFAIVGVAVASYYSKLELDKILNGTDGSRSGAQYLQVGPVDDNVHYPNNGEPDNGGQAARRTIV